METIKTTNKTTCRLSIAAATFLLIGGIWLCIHLLKQLPFTYGLSIGTFILWEVIGIAPIVIGGAWLRNLYRRRNNDTWRKGTLGGIIFGTLLVITGLLLFAFNSGTVLPEWRPVTISWQMLLITIGIINLWKPEITSGIILISVGTFFIIPRFGIVFPDIMSVNPDFVVNYWPILIAISGVAMILGLILRRGPYGDNGCDRKKEYRSNRCNCGGDTKSTSGESFTEATSGSNGTVNFNLIFSGSEHIFFEPVFRGGKISAIFGGMSLDLRRTTLPEGVTLLKVETVFGGAEIKVPEDWHVEIRSNSVFGAFSDSRKFYNDTYDGSRKLVIIAECVFGGGEVQ